MGCSTLKYLASAIFAFTLSACVFVPVVDRYDDKNYSCQTFTKSMSLDTLEVHANIVHGCNNQQCLVAALAAATVVSAGSAIISGSIVLTGNTVHWLEYQGTCSDGYLNVTRQLFLDSLPRSKPTPTN